MLLPGSGRIFSRSRIRTPFGKWDSLKSPQGYCCGVADPDFQISGGGGGGGGQGFGGGGGGGGGGGSQMKFFFGPSGLSLD